jgi:dTDP-L-rhamnose 4-epimerase
MLEGRPPMRARELVLITGGAGFIGSHVADALLARGYAVRLLDNLDAQVHGNTRHFPGYLASDVEAVHGDVRNPADMARALDGVSAVYHFAAAVGVGQSMYQIERYTDVNNRGTAVLLEALLKHPVRKLIVASSMSVYGEGQYRADGREVAPMPRSLQQLKRGDWEVRDADGRPLEPVPTREDKIISPQSIYALSKLDQETMCLLFGRTYGVATVALRFFNVYGPRQALANPYTGVLANFAARYLNGNAPIIFEDGLQKRDFVHVRDLARACVLALETPAADVALNIGSGNAYTILAIAQRLARVLGREDIEPEVSGRYRAGDIRNCYADISRATQVLGYRPAIALDDGLAELGEWLADSESEDHGATAVSELQARGLVA